MQASRQTTRQQGQRFHEERGTEGPQSGIQRIRTSMAKEKLTGDAKPIKKVPPLWWRGVGYQEVISISSDPEVPPI